MKVLVACEESQRVCTAFRERGHVAYSCDIIEPSGGHPEWHILGDAMDAIRGGTVTTMDDKKHNIGKWDLMIAHPPCTYLTVTGNRWYNVARYGQSAIERLNLREKAIEFFMAFANCDVDKFAIENPVGVMSTIYRKPDQIIQPWQFGHPTVKKTCLWLKGLPKLIPTNIVAVDQSDVYEYVTKNGNIKHDSRLRSKCRIEDRSIYRSKTFSGIAEAMAAQWG